MAELNGCSKAIAVAAETPRGVLSVMTQRETHAGAAEWHGEDRRVMGGRSSKVSAKEGGGGRWSPVGPVIAMSSVGGQAH